RLIRVQPRASGECPLNVRITAGSGRVADIRGHFVGAAVLVEPQGGGAGGQMQKSAAGKFHRRLTPRDHLVGATGYGVYVCAPPGRRTVKAEPLPGSLVTVTSPPIMRASLRVMARPKAGA